MKIEFTIPKLVIRIIAFLGLFFMAASIVMLVIQMIINPLLIAIVAGVALYIIAISNQKARNFFEEYLNR